MFDLGLGLSGKDFTLILRRPKALIMGLIGQILFLPAIAFALGSFFQLDGPMLVGLILIACCPGGSSSNVFSGIAHGDVALSVSLTAFSSLITLVTMPILMGVGVAVEFPVMNLVVQNLVLVLVPILAGMYIRRMAPQWAEKCHNILRRVAFPALMLLAVIFFVVNRDVIIDNFHTLGTVTLLMVLVGMLVGYSLSTIAGLNRAEKRTIIIEVGMQNAAQAMMLTASPFVFNDPVIAAPATVYALFMNVVLLMYVGVVSRFDPARQ